MQTVMQIAIKINLKKDFKLIFCIFLLISTYFKWFLLFLLTLNGFYYFYLFQLVFADFAVFLQFFTIFLEYFCVFHFFVVILRAFLSSGSSSTVNDRGENANR